MIVIKISVISTTTLITIMITMKIFEIIDYKTIKIYIAMTPETTAITVTIIILMINTISTSVIPTIRSIPE